MTSELGHLPSPFVPKHSKTCHYDQATPLLYRLAVRCSHHDQATLRLTDAATMIRPPLYYTWLAAWLMQPP